ncbi:hypothetical protein IU500_06990 [Nocardia terpenica]|uniref:hypothetical protein n=1 Tax=Nocardia terpenica TaxID=455432 RepID=UPI0018933EB2|nr:hypothetical protein [Nocardia terpenica]MBF6060522.1 hypothetical protein [Nocardia terpenica]MBF6103782.1 hypothetical protein [Nocardia terpenica]MBF6111844.1 hypothetical protein [Nocardia terpenica]MBF6118003.1 hypothetical protein [Nocardia terpenica]MBF6155271.1 hypothetical protein [Nocardia terpenica]
MTRLALAALTAAAAAFAVISISTVPAASAAPTSTAAVVNDDPNDLLDGFLQGLASGSAGGRSTDDGIVGYYGTLHDCQAAKRAMGLAEGAWDAESGEQYGSCEQVAGAGGQEYELETHTLP